MQQAIVIYHAILSNYPSKSISAWIWNIVSEFCDKYACYSLVIYNYSGSELDFKHPMIAFSECKQPV